MADLAEAAAAGIDDAVTRRLVQPVQIALYLAGSILAFMTVAPLLWMVSMSLKQPERGVRRQSRPAPPDSRELRLCLHPGELRPLSLELVLRVGGRHRGGPLLPLDGGLRAGAAEIPRSRLHLPRDVRDLPHLPARDHRALVHPGPRARPSRQLRGPDRSLDLQRLRHIPPAPVLSRRAARARGGGADRRRRLFPHLLVDRPAAEPADPLRRSPSCSSLPTGTRSSGR